MKPSMSEPGEKGIEYDTICWQIVQACPRLMQELSRTGNSSHGVHREMTILQACKNLHATYLENRNIERKDAVDLAMRDLQQSWKPKLELIAPFVEAYSGGKSAHVLSNLEKYERSLGVKRQTNPVTLKELASVDIPEAEEFITWMVKAMLNAPQNWVSKDGSNTAELFGSGDYSSLGASGKTRPYAVEAVTIGRKFRKFVEAYSQVDDIEKEKALSDCEVRLCMHVCRKKSDTRKDAKNPLEIVQVAYENLKKNDASLPVFQPLADVAASASSNEKKKGAVIRETSASGAITDAEFARRGFEKGADVVMKSNLLPSAHGTPILHTIKTVGKTDVDLTYEEPDPNDDTKMETHVWKSTRVQIVTAFVKFEKKEDQAGQNSNIHK